MKHSHKYPKYFLGTIAAAVGIGSTLYSLGKNLFGKKNDPYADMQEMQNKQRQQQEIQDNWAKQVELANQYQQQRNLELGNPQPQIFSYEKGKTAGNNMFNPSHFGKTLVDTSEGIQNGQQNAWTNFGETIRNRDTYDTHVVKHGKNDTAKSFITNRDDILGNLINPETGNPLKQDALVPATYVETINKNRPKGNGWLGKQTQKTYDMASKSILDKANAILDHLVEVQENEFRKESNNYKRSSANKYPKYSGGLPAILKGIGGVLSDPTTWGIASGAIGLLGGLSQINHAKNDEMWTPSHIPYVNNYGAQGALNMLSERSINLYPIMRQIKDSYGSFINSVDRSNLDATGKTNAKITALYKMNDQLGTKKIEAQKINNEYKKDLADAQLQKSTADTDRAWKTNAYNSTVDNNYYPDAISNRGLGLQKAINNIENVFSGVGDLMQYKNILKNYSNPGGGTSNKPTTYYTPTNTYLPTNFKFDIDPFWRYNISNDVQQQNIYTIPKQYDPNLYKWYK